jgi:glutaredoxin 3
MAVKVEIYGTSNCKKCVNVRDLLDRKKVEYIDYLIDLMPLEKDEMIRRTGLKYYPQIFINDEHVGGEEEMMTLEAGGELDKLLGLKNRE